MTSVVLVDRWKTTINFESISAGVFLNFCKCIRLILIIFLAANCAQAVVYWHKKIAIFNLPTLYAFCNKSLIKKIFLMV